MVAQLPTNFQDPMTMMMTNDPQARPVDATETRFSKHEMTLSITSRSGL